jgi:hypothetical protein
MQKSLLAHVMIICPTSNVQQPDAAAHVCRGLDVSKSIPMIHMPECLCEILPHLPHKPLVQVITRQCSSGLEVRSPSQQNLPELQVGRRYIVATDGKPNAVDIYTCRYRSLHLHLPPACGVLLKHICCIRDRGP